VARAIRQVPTFARRALAVACCSPALLAASPVLAQVGNLPDPARQAGEDDGRLDEIVVTARRREESLQDVPVAVSAFNAERISDLRAKDLSGLQYSVPNLYLDKGDASNAVIFIRGVGQNDSLAFADPGVGVYVDDVFVARTQAAFLDLFDVDRVEVLRGPQGTLYGRNTIGGAVKFVSTPPPRDFDAYAEAGIGNYGYYNLQGRIGGPIAGDALRAKAAFTFTRRDGYNHNALDGRDDGDVRAFAARGALAFEPSDRFELLLSVDGKIDRPDSSRSPVLRTSITGATAAGLVTYPASGDPYRVDTNANGLSDLTAFGTSATLRWHASDALTIESITAYRSLEFNLNLDTDGSPLPILDILLRQKEHQFSQELRLTHDDKRLLAFTGGLYYFHDRDDSFSGVDNGAATIFGFPVTDFGFATSSLADTRQTTDSYAAYGDATLTLTPRLSVSAGLRYTHEKRRSGRQFENFFDPAVSVIRDTPPFLAGAGVPGVPVRGDARFDAFTPKVSLSYKPAERALLYASVARGFKSGGFDGRATTDFGFQPFRPEYVWSYEGGAKTSWFDGRLVANAAFFYNNYTDIQVTSFGADPVSGAFVSLFTNAAKAHSYGAEFELAAQPTKRLSLNASAGWLHARYDAFNILVGTVATDASDRPLVNSPEWNASLGGTYTAPISDRLNGVIHLDGAYRSRTATEITASPILTQSGYALVNASVGLRSANDRWEVRAGVQNLTDHAVRTQGFNLADFPGVQVNFFSAPRTYDLRLTYRY
jgi:iron complex outermembrane receptor protein